MTGVYIGRARVLAQVLLRSRERGLVFELAQRLGKAPGELVAILIARDDLHKQVVTHHRSGSFWNCLECGLTGITALTCPRA